MASQKIATAMRRVELVLRRRPEAGLHDDAPATARLDSGTRVLSSHGNGTTCATDMPTELGGSGEQVTPGWLFRAGIASCLATRIAMSAAAAGINLSMLEVVASSRSDARGMLGMSEPSGEPVWAGPRDVQVLVRIAAPDILPQRLRSLIDEGNRCSPVSAAVRDAVPVTLCIEVAGE